VPLGKAEEGERGIGKGDGGVTEIETRTASPAGGYPQSARG